MAFDPSDDFADVADMQQAVTLLRPGTSDSRSLAHAVRGTVRASEARASGGRYTEEDVAWHLDGNELDDSPRPGDLIVEADARRWTVLAARRTAVGCWRCICRDLVIAHGLDQYVDIEVADFTKDATGAEVAAWRPWRTGVPARIQPVRAAVDNDHARRSLASEFIVYVAGEFRLDQTHRIKAPDGTIYRVVGCRKADRIDALMEIQVAAE
ncbi:MAG TPA: hypothetical protein VJL29_03480 [Thermoguttaceae bacterium]|nr:hypothetical protein [Thermoguttaceae bacterium]